MYVLKKLFDFGWCENVPLSGVDVMNTTFCDFRQFSAIFGSFRRKKWRFSQFFRQLLANIFLKS
jgi:hypothetical protein